MGDLNLGIVGKLCLGLSPTGLLFLHRLQGSLDNMTCILVCFPGAPRPSEEAIRRELALDAALGRRIAGEQTLGAQLEGWLASEGSAITFSFFLFFFFEMESCSVS